MTRLLVCICLTFWATGAAAQNLVITNARILDGKGGAIERGSVVVRDGKIVSVAAGAAAAAAGARVIDVKGMTVMPGFIDSHRHPIGQGADWLKTEAPARMQEFLDAGFTTVLSAGDDVNTAIPLRDQIAKGAIRGPRLIVLGRAPTAGAPAPPAGRGRGDAPPAGRGGGGAFGGRGDPARNVALRTPATTAATAVPADQTRATIASLAKAGVDGIKTVLQVTPGGPEIATQTLIVQEARKFNLPVMTHAVSVADTLGAVQAGVQSLAHTPHIDQLTMAQAQTVAKSGIPMMSTLGVFVPYFDAANTALFRDRLPFPWETLHRHELAAEGVAGARAPAAVADVLAEGHRLDPDAERGGRRAEERPRHARSRQARGHRRPQRGSARERVEPAERRDGDQGRRGGRRKKVAAEMRNGSVYNR
jgi:imidazolonepropionase-like amidohydrolase